MLGHRQGGAEAAADAAAEGDPLVGAGLAAEPALGAEVEGVGVEVLAVVDEEDAHRDRGVGRDAVARRAARGRSTRRPIIGITGRERIVSTIVASTCSSAPSPARTALAQRLVGGGVADQALPGPGQRVGGRLVAGEDEGEQLVAQFFVVQRLALLGPRLQQQREDVAALARGRSARRRAAITA